MFKPPKTSLLAALVVTVGCKGSPDQHAVGTQALEVPKQEQPKPEPHKIGKTNDDKVGDVVERPAPEDVGTVAKPIEPIPEKPKPAKPE